MKRFKVIILPSAESDIGDAYEWIAERDAEAAIAWYDRHCDIIDSLESLPLRCPVAPESKFFNTEIREIFHGRRQHRYQILFTVSNDTVYVLHVRHGARLRLGEDEPSEQ